MAMDFGAFDEDIVVSLTKLTLSAVNNDSYFSFAVAYLGYVSGGRTN